jgi:iron complex outermembrane recepter protein
MRGGRDRSKRVYKAIIKSTVRGLFALGCILAVSPPAHAAADNLGTIDVTAEGQAVSTNQASVPVTVIDRKAIAASHAENVVDLLKGQPGIVVRDTSGVGAKSSVDLGGFGESAAANSVVLIDGRRVNSPDLSGVDWTQIPLDQIERIEIVHGGGASLYGNGAVGGVINIITRIPEAGGHVSVRGGSFGSGGFAASIGADSGRTRVEANASGYHTDGYRTNSKFERLDGGMRAEADLPSGFSLRLSGNEHHDQAGLPGALTAAQMAADRRQSTSPRDFSRTSDGFVDAGISWDGAAGLGLDVDGGLRRRETHYEYPSYGSIGDNVIDTQSLRPKLHYETDVGVHVSLLGGADLESSKGNWINTGLAPTTFDRVSEGYYGHLHLGGASSRWNLSGGVRTERIRDRFVQTSTTSVSGHKNAWDAGGSFALTGHLLLRLHLEQSVRFPLLDERFSLFSGTLNTALQPQTGHHVGAGLRYTLGRSWIEASFSRADLSNEIYFNPLTFANENYADRTRHDVWMIVGHWRASDLLQWSASYTHTVARFRGGSYAGHWIPAVPQQQAAIAWTADWTGNLGTTLSLRYVGDSYLISDQANAGPELPGYAVADAVVRYRLQHVRMFARVDNLTNRKYSTYGVTYGGPAYYYPAAGIAVSTGADYRF